MLLAGIIDLVRWTYTGNGYNIVSGPLPDVTLLAGVGMLWRRHNCHTAGCPFLVWRAHPDRDAELLCRVHHPHGHGIARRVLVAFGWATVRQAAGRADRRARQFGGRGEGTRPGRGG